MPIDRRVLDWMEQTIWIYRAGGEYKAIDYTGFVLGVDKYKSKLQVRMVEMIGCLPGGRLRNVCLVGVKRQRRRSVRRMVS